MSSKLCVTKRQFMYQLRNKLILKNNANEIINILKDYEEFFETGLSRGKTEEELCIEFGNPQNIIDDMNVESNNSHSCFNIFKLSITKLFSIFFLSIITSIYLLSVYYNHNIVSISVAIIFLFVVGLWYVISGKFVISSIFLHYTNNKSGFNKPYLSIVLMVINVGVFFFIKNIIPRWASNKIPFNISPSQLGSYVDIMLFIIILIDLVIVLYSLWNMYVHSLLYYSVVIVCFGSICTILCYINVIHKITNINEYKDMITFSIIPFLFGLVLSLLFMLYFRLRYRGEYK